MNSKEFFLKSIFVVLFMFPWMGRGSSATTVGGSSSSSKSYSLSLQAHHHNGDKTLTPSTSSAANNSSNNVTPLLDHLHVCVVVEPSPITYMSGYANRFLELFLHLDRCGDSVSIVTTEVVVQKTNRPTTHLGFPVIYTRGFRLPHYPIMSISWDWTFALPRTLVLGKTRRPDLIHVSSPGFFVLWSILWARLLQIPLAVSYHTHLPVYVRSYLPKWLASMAEPLVWFLLRICHNLVDLTMVTSSALQLEFQQHGMSAPYLWPKGIDTTRFHPKWASREWRNRLSNNHPNDCLLLYVGRLAVEKRLPDLLALLKALPDQYRLAFVGKGPWENELKSLFAECNNRVVFLGPLYGQDLQKAYASADIFVLPSDSETLGFVVMEAMASGIPVVAARAGGIPDMIQHGATGFVVTVGDVEGYVQAIEQIGVNHAEGRRQMGRTARDLTESWTWEESMTVLRNEIYLDALENFHRRTEQRLWRFFTRRKANTPTNKKP